MKVNTMQAAFPHHAIPGIYGSIYPFEADFQHREQFPLINIAEDRESFYVRALMPGADPAQIRLKIREGTLVLEGNIATTSGVFHRQERFSGAFRRELALKSKVLPHKALAVMKHGVLDLVLPKAL